MFSTGSIIQEMSENLSKQAEDSKFGTFSAALEEVGLGDFVHELRLQNPVSCNVL